MPWDTLQHVALSHSVLDGRDMLLKPLTLQSLKFDVGNWQ